MRKITRSSELEELSLSDLGEDYQILAGKAKEALSSSYSPYSNFAVGAAVLLKNGKILKGSNQENAAYPSGLCAERTALFSAGAQFPQEQVLAIAIVFSDKAHQFAFPCGACLQVMSEYQVKQSTNIDVLMLHPQMDEVLLGKGVQNLLPFAFEKSFLKK